MTRLAPEVIAHRFQDLVELGRARLPGLAPGWTDYNAHDPGITLMELLAWVTEAQLYSVGRTRRDERAAYAALFGLAPGGTEPARGLLWPDPLDVGAPVRTYAQSVVIPADASVSLTDSETPAFRPDGKLLWVPGRVRRLVARLEGGREVDYTVANQRGGPAFLPFGTEAGSGDVLRMEFECRGPNGLFPPDRRQAEGAWWPIGVRADKSLTAEAVGNDSRFSPEVERTGRSLTATLVTPSARVPLPIASDTSLGLLRTGALLLDLSAVKDSPSEFVIELRAARGFERPPRLLRIEPNVVPILQGSVIDERHEATGLPDWSFRLEEPGLRFEPNDEPLRLRVGTGKSSEWSRRESLADCGPDDRVYLLDTTTDRVTFGNGVNGRIPPRSEQVQVSYAVSNGALGDVTANRRWRVSGFTGTFGLNLDAIGGGEAATQSSDERREARRRAREDHALVNADDITSAARQLPLLEVARAWVLPPGPDTPRTGAVNLVVMRARRSLDEEGGIPETSRWLEAIRRQLSPRMPLASRLQVDGPRYVGFSIRARVEAANGNDPATVKAAIEKELVRRLALSGEDPRAPGAPVSRRDLTAWIRAVDGVRRVLAIAMIPASGREVDEIKLPRNGLPRFDLAGSNLEVQRAGAGGAT